LLADGPSGPIRVHSFKRPGLSFPSSPVGQPSNPALLTLPSRYFPYVIFFLPPLAPPWCPRPTRRPSYSSMSFVLRSCVQCLFFNCCPCFFDTNPFLRSYFPFEKCQTDFNLLPGTRAFLIYEGSCLPSRVSRISRFSGSSPNVSGFFFFEFFLSSCGFFYSELFVGLFSVFKPAGVCVVFLGGWARRFLRQEFCLCRVESG